MSVKGDDSKRCQASSYFEAGPPTLVNIALDLQILICTLLHPFDILALRETCKTLQLATRRRVVWVVALRRVCLDNSLFLPSFPILDMSDAELEHAAMGPRRWIKLSSAFQNQRPDGFDMTLRLRTTRIIEDSSVAAEDNRELFIVPGGRYIVSYSNKGIHVWDLGYTSSSDCKLIASVELEGEQEVWKYNYMVQATPDGMGLILLSAVCGRWSVYEIYPDSETPQLTRIAHLDLLTEEPPCLLHDRVFWYECYRDMIVFRVWDYRLNHSVAFFGGVDTSNFNYNIQMIVTKTEIILLRVEEILVWVIPPLLPQLPDLSDHNHTHITPFFRMAFRDGVVSHYKLVAWKTMSQWYSGSLQPLYFDILCRDSILHRFEIIIKPDGASLHLISTKVVPHNFNRINLQKYKMCEDTLVAYYGHGETKMGVYTGLASFRSTTVLLHGYLAPQLFIPTPGYNYSLCPASGRYVYLDKGIDRIVVVGFF